VQQQGQSLGYAFSNSPELRIQLYDSVVVLDAQGDTIGFLHYNYRDSVVRHNIQNPTQSYIQIPFAVSKTFNVTGRFQVLAGLQLNSKFLLNAHGTAISPGLKGMNQNKDHFSSIGIGLGLNLGMAYYVSENIMMEVSGGSLFDLNNQSRIPDYTQRYGLYKLEFGLYYRIR
jgi:hypothetical protein